MIAREYETVYVLKADVPEGHAPKVVEKVSKAIERLSGTLLGVDEWGKKKLAYDIAKNNRGIFVQVGYCGLGKIVEEVERELRLDEGVVRHFTIKIADEVDSEKRQKEYVSTKRMRREAPEEDDREDTYRTERSSDDRGYSSRDFDDSGRDDDGDDA